MRNSRLKMCTVMIGQKTLLWRLVAVAVLAAAPLAADDKNPPPPVQVAPTPAQPTGTPQASSTPAATQAAPKAPAAVEATVPTAAPRRRNAADLERLVAPIALYPDPLLASVLTASAYPLEVVQAARFVKNTNNLAKLDEQPWDQNVKTVARFPEVIDKMSEELSWTVELGQAFVAQQMDVMDAVQTLRGQAQAKGALRSTPEQTVTVTDQVVEQAAGPTTVYVTNQVVQILPAQPEVIYVPQYEPAVVYAPGYVYDPWFPWVTFGFGIACGPWFWSDCYWHGGYVVCGGWGHYPYGWYGYPCYPYAPGPYAPYGPYHGSYMTKDARTSTESRTGGNQAASTRLWQADPNRLANSYGASRPAAGTTAASSSGARATRPQISAPPGSATGTRNASLSGTSPLSAGSSPSSGQATRPQISARPAAAPGTAATPQSGTSPTLANSRTASGGAARPASAATSTRPATATVPSRQAVGSSGVSTARPYTASPSGQAAARPAPASAGAPRVQSTWRGTATAPLPARSASGAVRYWLRRFVFIGRDDGSRDAIGALVLQPRSRGELRRLFQPERGRFIWTGRRLQRSQLRRRAFFRRWRVQRSQLRRRAFFRGRRIQRSQLRWRAFFRRRLPRRRRPTLSGTEPHPSPAHQQRASLSCTERLPVLPTAWACFAAGVRSITNLIPSPMDTNVVTFLTHL